MKIINNHSEPTEIIVEVAFRKSADLKISRKTKVYRTAAQREVSTKDVAVMSMQWNWCPVHHTPPDRAFLVAKETTITFLYKKGRFYRKNTHGIRTKTRIPKGTKAAFLFRGPQGSFLASFSLTAATLISSVWMWQLIMNSFHSTHHPPELLFGSLSLNFQERRFDWLKCYHLCLVRIHYTGHDEDHQVPQQ